MTDQAPDPHTSNSRVLSPCAYIPALLAAGPSPSLEPVFSTNTSIVLSVAGEAVSFKTTQSNLKTKACLSFSSRLPAPPDPTTPSAPVLPLSESITLCYSVCS